MYPCIPSVKILYNPPVEFKNQVLKAIKDGNPIYYCRPPAQGDGLIHLWTHRVLLGRLAEEACIDPGKLQLKSYPRTQAPPKNDVNFGNYQDLNSSIEDLHKIGVVGYKLQTIANRLGITLSPDDFALVPQPSFADFKPWSDFSDEKVSTQGQYIREDILKDYSRIVVVGQFGSQAEKRFSDTQVVEIAKKIKQQDPNSFVAVVSDKDHLKDVLPKPWHWLTRPDSYYAFPYKAKEFKHDLCSRSFDGFPDALISGKDINQFCSMFYASDLLITTDSFGAWLGCGSRSLREDRQGRIQASDAVILHTVANPAIWGVPGATLVISCALDLQCIMTGSQFDFLDYDGYYQGQFPRGTIKSNDPRRGILPRDFDKLEKAITKPKLS